MEFLKRSTLGILVAGCLLTPGSGMAQSSTTAESPLSQLSGSFENLAQRVSPAVVQLFATGYSSDLVTADSGLLSKNRSGG